MTQRQRIRPLIGIVAALTVAVTVLGGALVSPAAAQLTWRVSCDGDNDDVVLLDRDDTHYELSGTCGHVRVIASRSTVDMPTGRLVEVRGSDNTLRSKNLDRLIVAGSGHRVEPTAARIIRLKGRSTVASTGLVERAHVTGNASRLTAREIHLLRIDANRTTIRARKAWTVHIDGRGNTARFRLLDRLSVDGRRNTVRWQRRF